MKDEFEQTNLPPIKWYIGEVVEHKGELKIQWNMPGRQPMLKTEQELAMHERSARDMLIQRHEDVEPEWTNAVHAKWRDLHYNAEYGLAAVQTAKREKSVQLDTPFKPVVPNKI